jgi:hypothetical protein
MFHLYNILSCEQIDVFNWKCNRYYVYERSKAKAVFEKKKKILSLFPSYILFFLFTVERAVKFLIHFLQNISVVFQINKTPNDIK